MLNDVDINKKTRSKLRIYQRFYEPCICCSTDVITVLAEVVCVYNPFNQTALESEFYTSLKCRFMCLSACMFTLKL